jgi:hypothetical protein
MQAWSADGFAVAAGLDVANDAAEPAQAPRRLAATATWASAAVASAPAAAASAPPALANAPLEVQRKASPAAAAPSASSSKVPAQTGGGARRLLELYLAANELHVWRAVGEHARSVAFPEPHPRLTWADHPRFVRALLMQLEGALGDCTPLARLDGILAPSTAERTLAALLPATDAWSPPLGLALAQALQLAVVSSLRRLGPRYLDVADSLGIAGDASVPADSIIASMPIDRLLAKAMATPRALSIEPLSAKAAANAKGKPVALRPVTLAWEGERDPHLWNWVRATAPSDATAEEVAAAAWRFAPDAGHGEEHAYQLAAAPPLFGLPKAMAVQLPQARQYAPANARGASRDDSPQAQLVELASTASPTQLDEIARQQAAAHRSTAAPSSSMLGIAHDLPAVLADLQDCELQLAFMQHEATAWGLGATVAPALAFVHRKQRELLAVDAAALAPWKDVIAGQRARLYDITGAFHKLASTAHSLGVKDPHAAEARPVREILQLLATAAGTSQLAKSSEASLSAALALQASLNARAVQATERDLQAATLEASASLGSARAAADISHTAAGLEERSRRLQTQLINGSEVDAAELDEVTLASQELALRSRLVGTFHSISDLQLAAIEARDGLAAHVALLFSGRFRNLDSLCAHLTDQLAPIQGAWMESNRQLGEHGPAATPEQTAAQAAGRRAGRRAALSKAQAAFAKLTQDPDLVRVLRDGPKLVENQRFRTACVQMAPPSWPVAC